MSLVSISRGGMTAQIDTMGAQLMSLTRNGAEYLWQRDERWWGKTAPVLFPMVGSLRDDCAETAQGPAHMGRHGVARTVEHEVASVSEDGSAVTFELVSTPETRAAFPFDFKLNMTYAITGEVTLAQTFTVTNTGSVDLPFSVGGHPAFNVPVPGAEGEGFDDYELAFTEPWTCVAPKIAEGGLLTFDKTTLAVDASDTMPLTHRTFDDDAVMLSHVPGNTLTLRGRVSGHGIKVDFPGFDFIGIWSAAGDAPFVALEPWTGHATLTSEDDVFEHKNNITVLAPGQVDERTFTITLI